MASNAAVDPTTDTIPVVGRQELETLGLIQLNIFEHQQVPISTIAQQMEKVMNGLNSVLQKLPAQLGGFHLTEMQIALEITAKGTVNVLGSGGELGGKGGITLKLTK
jgi:hypothetical protein